MFKWVLIWSMYFVVGFITLHFLFHGSPNVYDRLHSAAMSVGRTECYKP